MSRVAITSLKKELELGKSLALLKPEITDFYVKKKPEDEFRREIRNREALKAQSDLFVRQNIIPGNACPYSFHYRYRDEDGDHDGTCQDWETEATFHRRKFEYGEEQAIAWMINMFGEVYPAKGMALAMGTHRYRADQWLINGVVRLSEETQPMLL